MRLFRRSGVCHTRCVGHRLRFQVLSVPSVPMADLIDRFVWLEALGVDVGALADHFVDWSKPTNDWFECWTTLAAIAAKTSSMRLTSCVTQIPLRNPAMLAKQAITVDHISGGRLEIGLGTGITIDPSTEMIGQQNWSEGERVERFGEYVEIVDSILVEEVTSFSGRYYQVSGAESHPRPVQRPRPPIMVGALGPRMIRRAARYADIWNSLSFSDDFDVQLAETAERVDRMRHECATAGRDAGDVRFSYTIFDAEARPKGGRIRYYESEDLFVELVERAIALGMSEISLYYPMDATQLPVFERLMTQTVPAIRARHATT